MYSSNFLPKTDFNRWTVLVLVMKQNYSKSNATIFVFGTCWRVLAILASSDFIVSAALAAAFWISLRSSSSPFPIASNLSCQSPHLRIQTHGSVIERTILDIRIWGTGAGGGRGSAKRAGFTGQSTERRFQRCYCLGAVNCPRIASTILKEALFSQ